MREQMSVIHANGKRKNTKTCCVLLLMTSCMSIFYIFCLKVENSCISGGKVQLPFVVSKPPKKMYTLQLGTPNCRFHPTTHFHTNCSSGHPPMKLLHHQLQGSLEKLSTVRTLKD